MLAQVFLDASTRYFPGLSMLLKRGVTNEQIEEMRSKSSEWRINVVGVRGRAVEKQAKTERRLNWKDGEVGKNRKDQNVIQ